MLFQVCAVGWEPNPTHTERLQNLSDAYNKCGFRTIIYTETGVDVRNSKIKVKIQFHLRPPKNSKLFSILPAIILFMRSVDFYKRMLTRRRMILLEYPRKQM